MPSKGNGAPPDEGATIHVNVVDRRHHARNAEERAGAPDAAKYPTFVEELKARTEEAEKRAREAVVAAHAELDAVRDRLQRDVERRVAEAKAGLFASLLEVLDNLDRASHAARGESAVVGEGLELIRQQLLSLLQAEGVEPIGTLGLEYDPNVAEALMIEPVEPARDNIVLEEIQRGYRYGSVVLRPARVKVGKSHRS